MYTKLWWIICVWELEIRLFTIGFFHDIVFLRYFSFSIISIGVLTKPDDIDWCCYPSLFQRASVSPTGPRQFGLHPGGPGLRHVQRPHPLRRPLWPRRHRCTGRGACFLSAPSTVPASQSSYVSKLWGSVLRQEGSKEAQSRLMSCQLLAIEILHEGGCEVHQNRVKLFTHLFLIEFINFSRNS